MVLSLGKLAGTVKGAGLIYKPEVEIIQQSP
jgi:hypothetical protein